MPLAWRCAVVSDTRALFFSQLYVHACSSSPAHPNVCRLLGWGVKAKGTNGPTLQGLTDGDQVYMVQEFAGEELQETINKGTTVPPAVAYNYLTQLAGGADLCPLPPKLLCLLKAHTASLQHLCT